MATRPDRCLFGYLPKADAMRLLALLLRAGVQGRLGFDEQLARLHARATRVDPKIRRRSSFRDVKSGYFVQVPPEEAGAARAVIATSSFRDLVRPERADAGVPCASCDRPLPPGERVCPHCDGGSS